MVLFVLRMKQAGKWSGSLDPWPPFQPLPPSNPVFKGLYELLHTKTLHGIIFNIFFKVRCDIGIMADFEKNKQTIKQILTMFLAMIPF